MQLFLTAAQKVLYNKMVEQRKKRMKSLSEIPLARFILSKIFTQVRRQSLRTAFLFLGAFFCTIRIKFYLRAIWTKIYLTSEEKYSKIKLCIMFFILFLSS